MRISELAERTGVSPRLLRHYEGRGLLNPARDAHGWRVYENADRERVEQIRLLLDAGIPTGLALRIMQEDLTADLLAEITVFYERIDARVRCLSRNRDALAAWLSEHVPDPAKGRGSKDLPRPSTLPARRASR